MTATINASTSSGVVTSADTSGALALQSNGTTKLTVDSTGAYGQLVSGTAVASTSGTSITFTGIPSWVKRVTVILNGISLSGSANGLVQIGSGSVTTTGYLSGATVQYVGATEAANSTSGYLVALANATRVLHGSLVLTLIASNTWVASGSFGFSNAAASGTTGGSSPSLSGVLDRVVITTTNGTDTFDAGSINILYEG
jgi:hypothetical protein